MKPTLVALVLFLLTVANVGCTSSSSSDDTGQDMSQLAAAVDQQAKAATTPVASPKSPAPAPADGLIGSATSPSAASSAAPAPAAPANPNLRTKRGFDLKDWSNEATYVLVKADAEKTVNALARAWNGKVLKNVLGKPDSEKLDQVIVYQLAGHPWSIFTCDGSQIEPLSKNLISDADVMFIWNSDFNGWSGCDFYRAGQEVEAVHWGPDGDNIGEDADASRWYARGTLAHSFEGEGDVEGDGYNDLFLFRSKARKVTEADLQKGEAFVDAFLRHHDAYLPDVEQMPWGELDDSNTVTTPFPPAAFAGVHAVELTE